MSGGRARRGRGRWRSGNIPADRNDQILILTALRLEEHVRQPKGDRTDTEQECIEEILLLLFQRNPFFRSITGIDRARTRACYRSWNETIQS